MVKVSYFDSYYAKFKTALNNLGVPVASCARDNGSVLSGLKTNCAKNAENTLPGLNSRSFNNGGENKGGDLSKKKLIRR